MTFVDKCMLGFGVWIALSCSFVLIYTSPIKDSCEVMDEEIEDFYPQGEAVLIRFPFLEAVISHRKLLIDNSSTFQLSHSKLSSLKNLGHRVVQNGRALWLLPSLPSDSGIYTYVFRSNTYCISGNISVTIYATGKENIDMMSYPVTSQPHGNLTVKCPHLNYFNRMGNPQWYKGFHAGFPLSGVRYFSDGRDSLTIRNISREDQGLYTCRLKVIFNNKLYNVSRTWKLQVLVPTQNHLETTNTESSSKSSDVTSPSYSTITPFIIPEIDSDVESNLVIACLVVVGTCPFFVLLVCVFLRLFFPQRRRQNKYILASQSSTCST